MKLLRPTSIACVCLLPIIAGCINPPSNNLSAGLTTGTSLPAQASAPIGVTIGNQVSATGSVCRIGPNGGPPPGAVPPLPRHRQVTADRGIGGTGAPTIAASVATPIGPSRGGDVVADRGIGGTGTVGVVTGFASTCVDGLEVAYDSSAPVDINGITVNASWLRVGQVVAIHASSATPVASTISVRVEVTGRIERIALGNGQLQVGGQPVLVGDGIPGADRFTLGDWVAVSGLRRTD